MSKRFIRLTWGPQLIGLDHRPEGAIVEVDEHRARHMLEAKAAVAAEGPARDPEPIPEPAKKPKKADA